MVLPDMNEVLGIRCKIARLGERDSFAWWDSSAGTDDGLYALQRLFARTAPWVGIELSIAAARARHEALLPKVRAVHLFDLGSQTERVLGSMIRELKVAQKSPEEWWPCTAVVLSVSSVGEALRLVGLAGTSLEDRLAPSDRAVCVGEVDEAALGEPLGLAQRLVEGYCHSTKSSLVVPYLRLVAA